MMKKDVSNHLSNLALEEEVRLSSYKINPLILNRWSPSSGEELKDEEVMSLFEAARWAPSSGNGQPWRFIYAKRNAGEDWNRLLNLLVDFNKSWAKDAAVL